MSRRLSTRILISQFVVLALTVLTGFGLYVRALRHDLDRAYEQRALSIAEAAATSSEIQRAMAVGDKQHAVAGLAERIRKATGASYVVVLDVHGIRHSHPNTALIGEPVTEPLIALDGRGHVGIDQGHLGRSANGKAPLRAPDGRLIGEVSAGILESRISAEVRHAVPSLLLYSALALGLGALASFLLARRLKRQTFGLELDEIAELLQEREAMLHGIREGVITLDPAGRVSLINDEARRLLRLGTSVLDERLIDLLPEGRLRDLLTGAAGETADEIVLTNEHCLLVTRMPVEREGRALGAVITMRDRTEVVGLLRELDSVRSLTDALRAQQHEHANRMHTLAGLLELGRYDDAAGYLTEIAGTSSGLAETLRNTIDNPTVVALLLSKVSIAAERGVELIIESGGEETSDAVDEVNVETRSLVTIIGNLVDNAIDAAAGRTPPRVTVRFAGLPTGELSIEVSDTGPGVPGNPGAVFADGYSTKGPRDGIHRGLGLALVHRLVVQAGGQISVENRDGALFRVTLPRRVPARTAAPEPAR